MPARVCAAACAGLGFALVAARVLGGGGGGGEGAGAAGGDLPRVTISQICGSGGVNASCPNFDFVELHNAGALPAALLGWSVQLSLGNSANWTVIPLDGVTIAPGAYALVRCEVPLAVGQAPTRTPDVGPATGTSPLLSHVGKVALVASPLSVGISDPRALLTVRDFVGYGGVGPSEGARAPSPGAGPPARVLVRRCGGDRDSGNNAGDFLLAPYQPNLPRSSESPVRVPGPDVLAALASPVRAAPGEPILLTVAIDTCEGPAVSVHADITGLGGSANQALVDDGTSGDSIAGDGVFSFLVSSPQAVSGVWSLPVRVETGAGGSAASASITVIVLPTDQTGMKISQVYAGGGVDDAAFNADYVELHNAGADTIDLCGSTLLVAGPVGSTWTRVPLTGIVPGGAYMLVRLGEVAGVGMPLPEPDIVADQSLLLSSGCKVALVADPLPVSASCPGAAERVTDLVGTGTADCREGSAPQDNAPWPGLIHRAILRACEGGIDTNQNSTDWQEGAPQPRNRSTPPASGVTITSVNAEGPAPVSPGQSLVVRVQVADCVGAGFDQVAVELDATALDVPAPLQARDDGLAPDSVANDGQYTAQVTVGPSAPPGPALLAITAVTLGPRFARATLTVQIVPAPVGACCLQAQCSTVGESACLAAGGRWLGAGTTCTPVSPLTTPVPYAGIPALPNPIFDQSNDRYEFTIANTGLLIGPAGLRVALHLQHTWIGDLTIEINNANSAETLIARVGQVGGSGAGAAANLDGWYVFHDLARQSIWEAAASAGTDSASVVPPGEYRLATLPDGTPSVSGLRAFSGQPLDGEWFLRIRDDGVGDTGFLLGLTLADNSVLSPCCPPDWNGDGILDPDDLADLIACYFIGQARCPRGDLDGNGQIDPDDLADGIAAYFGGCP